jgi:2-amino-4-hydroxy-6-hydroxymethyldihydropteridine diphosphokinase
MPDKVRAASQGWRYAIGVGGNRGDVAATFARAAALLTCDGLVRMVAQASIIHSAPLGGVMQPDFHNSVWIVATTLGPHGLLMRLMAVEHACGRCRTVRWGPRTLDLDLLLRDDQESVVTPVLQLPHARMMERAFVLLPLREVAGDWRVPNQKKLMPSRLVRDLPVPV